MLNKLNKHDLNCNIFSVYDYDGLTMQELLCQFFTKINECIDVSNEALNFLTWLKEIGIKEEVALFLNTLLENGTIKEIINKEIFQELNNKIDKIKNDVPMVTPQDFGAIGDGIADDSQALLNAMNECANKGYLLTLNKKYRIASNIEYQGIKPLTIIGTIGNYPSLLPDTISIENEHCNIFFDNANLILNKMGSVTFITVGFSSSSKESGYGIKLKSFHNKFLMCTFSQMEKAIHTDEGATNWIGENQILYSNFYKCKYCLYSEHGSDSEFIGNLIHGTCDVGLYGTFAGYTINSNHFYNRQPNIINYFNTKITNNYIQELLIDEPSFILDGSFGCMVENNNFELNNNEPKPSPKGLIGLKLNSGKGNIIFNGNSVNGKNNTIVENLSFIKLIYDTTKHDMPLTIGTNNLRCCKALFNEHYPYYNLKGATSYNNITIGTGKTADTMKVNVVNGITYAYIVISSPTIANTVRFNNSDFPVIANCRLTKTSGGNEVKQYYVGVGEWLSIANYGELSKIEIIASYPTSQSTEVNYIL